MRPDLNTPEENPVVSVSALVRQMKFLMESNFPYLWVEGEVTNLRIPASGHAYFSLKDENAELPAVMFRRSRSQLAFDLKNGDRIQCAGKITLYEPQGKAQIIVERARPVGAGHLLAAFEALKKKLLEEGLFEEEHKKYLPVLPRRVGIITSPTGAAIRDMLRVLHDRYPIPVLLAPVSVQGYEAPGQIIKALEALDQVEDVDVIIVGRGGGSIEDLWAFNHENLARAIFNTHTPVVSAVGHETDFLLSDMVADLRAATPTHAAELVVPIQDELEEAFSQMRQRLGQQMKWRIANGRQRLMALRPRDPSQILEQRMMRLDELTTSMETSLRYQLLHRRRLTEGLTNDLRVLHPAHRMRLYQRKVQDLRHRLLIGAKRTVSKSQRSLDLLQAQLGALGPKRILERGYAIVRHGETGALVKSTSHVQTGDPIRVTVADGDIHAEVKNGSTS